MRSKDPLISVIVPIYKVESYISSCVDSIINQSYKNLEIILVDDGSPDQCPHICDSYAEKDKRVKVIHQKNSGQSKARNIALDCCNGEYIAFVDGDDWIQMNAFEKALNEIQNQDVDVAFYTANIIVNGKAVENRFRYFPNKTVLPQRELIERTLKDDIGGQPWLKLMKRKCWTDVRFPVGRIYEDLAISFRPFLHADKGAIFLDEPLYNYRMNLSGTSLGNNPHRNYFIFLAFKDHYDYACQCYISLREECLANTAKFAIGYCNNRIQYNIIDSEEKLLNVEKWLKAHLSEITACSKLPRKRKIAIKLFLQSRKVYIRFYKIFIKIKQVK